jgi:hypothetical protein
MKPLLLDGLEMNNIQPPLVLAKRGRPLTKRLRKRVAQQDKQNRCTNLWCRQKGHNKRRCTTVQTLETVNLSKSNSRSSSDSESVISQETATMLQAHVDQAREREKLGLKSKAQELRDAREEIARDVISAQAEERLREEEMNAFWDAETHIQSPQAKGKQSGLRLIDEPGNQGLQELDSITVKRRVLRSAK